MVKPDVMRCQHCAFDIAVQFAGDILKGRRVPDHLIGDACQARDERGDVDARIDQRLPAIGFYSVFKTDESNLGNAIV